MITKKNKDLKKGDTIRTEFGDYNNIVTVVVESAKPCADGKYTLIIGHYAGNRAHVEMYGKNEEEVEVIDTGRKA